MDEEMLLVERDGLIVTITINRPDARNALHPDLLGRLVALFAELSTDGVTRCAVIRGAGDKAFSAGYDIASIPESEGRTPQNVLREAMSAISEFPFPVIAMIHGYCVGAGFELAAACDVRVAAEDARFAMTPAKLGVLYHWSGMLRFMNLVGLGWTKYLFCTGRQISAQRAQQIGLVEEVAPVEQLEQVAYALAREIADNAPLSVCGAKQSANILLNYQQISPEDIDRLMKIADRCFESEDVREGKRAFAEKRKPSFRGR